MLRGVRVKVTSEGHTLRIYSASGPLRATLTLTHSAVRVRVTPALLGGVWVEAGRRRAPPSQKGGGEGQLSTIAASLSAGGRLRKRGVGGGPTRGTILCASTLLCRLQCRFHVWHRESSRSGRHGPETYNYTPCRRLPSALLAWANRGRGYKDKAAPGGRGGGHVSTVAPHITLRPHCPQRCLAPSTASTAAWSRAWLTHSAPGCLPWLTCGGAGWAGRAVGRESDRI